MDVGKVQNNNEEITMLPPEDRELLKSSRKASVSAPSPFQRPYFGSANAAEHRASSSAPKPVVKPHPVKSGFTKGSYSGSANAAEHRQILNVQKEDQAVKKVQIEQQKRLAKIPNYHNAAVNSEMREAVITQVHQDALKDPTYRAHEARVKRETDLAVKAQHEKVLQELSKQQPQEKKHWWDKATDFVKDHAETIGHGALDAAGFIPVVGGVADLANAGWYLAEGDKTNAALSAAAAVPFAGDAVAATAIGAKIAIKTAVAAKGVHLASAAVGGTRIINPKRLSGAKDALKLVENHGIGKAALESRLADKGWVKTEGTWGKDAWKETAPGQWKPNRPLNSIWTNPKRTESIRIRPEGQGHSIRGYNGPSGGTAKVFGVGGEHPIDIGGKVGPKGTKQRYVDDHPDTHFNLGN